LKTNTATMDFSLEKACKFAWDHAVKKMAPLLPKQMPAAIHDPDLEAAEFGHMVVSPPWLIKLELMPIRTFESRT